MRVADMWTMSPLSDAEHADQPDYLTEVLLAFGGNIEAVKELHTSSTNQTPSTLPELFSAVFKHPDLDDELRVDLWNKLSDTNRSDIDSPEYIGALLGMKVESITSRQKQRIAPDTSILSMNPQYDKIKKLVDEFFTLEVVEDWKTQNEMANKFIRLFATLENYRQTIPTYYDLFVTLQEFCFTYTKDFENAVEAYKTKLNCEKANAEEEPNEPDKGAGSSVSTPILEVPQNLAFAENDQRL